MELSEQLKFVPLLVMPDINAGSDMDSINMKNYHSATLVITFDNALAGDPILTLNSGASDGTKTTAETFSYRYGSAATASATSDTLTTRATSAGLEITGATLVSRMLICEIDASAMTVGQEFLTPSLSAAGSAGGCHCVAILTPRYQGNVIPSAIPA